MKKALNLFSLLAFGLLIAGVMVVLVSGGPSRAPQGPGLFRASTPEAGTGALDPVSLLVGLAAGWVLAFAGRIPWLELPQRAVNWLLRNERNMLRFGMAGLLLAVVIYY